MTFLYINYINIYDLILKFQKINFNNQIADKTSNFVVVNENLYCGFYGGIFSINLIDDFKKDGFSFIHDLISPNLCILWWNCYCTKKGDMSLKRDNFVLITKLMFYKLKSKPLTKINSSYYK